jgi:ferredoxin-NADP reductase
MSVPPTGETQRETAGQPAADRAWFRRVFAHAMPSHGKLPRVAAPPHAAARVGRFRRWADRLFAGAPAVGATPNRIVILKDGVEIDALPIESLAEEATIGRHPTAQIRLESYKLGFFHATLSRRVDGLYLETIDDSDTLLARRRLKPGVPVPLGDGALVDVPGFQLRFHMSGMPAPESVRDTEALDEIPSYFYHPGQPASADPIQARLIEDRAALDLWANGTVNLRVVDVVEETADVKTFRLVGAARPILFSYRPGQFATLLLTIAGQPVERAYSISSSPSRPHMLELTVKRVPGGLVSNWLCDHVAKGQTLRVKGPSGRFTCLDHPAPKLLMLSAGSGITPVMSMSRWIADTAPEADVKFLTSFRTVSDVIFRKELELIAARHPGFSLALTLTGAGPGSAGLAGRIDAAMIRKLVPDLAERQIFLCGPEPFAAAARMALAELGVDPTRVHSESFGSGATRPAKRALELSGPRHHVTFTKSGKTVETDETVSLLELAEAHGVRIDYACRSGSCGECEVRIAGRVSEAREFDKVPRSKDGGTAYACCSAARSDLEVAA